MEQLDALTAKDCFVVRAIEMFNTVRVLAAELVLHGCLSVLERSLLVLKVKVAVGEHLVFLHDLV